MVKAAFLACLVAITACAEQQDRPPVVIYKPQEVKVPVPVKPVPPEELTRPVQPALPVLIGPAQAGAAVCMADADWRKMQSLLSTLKRRDRAWLFWALAPAESPPK